MSALPGDPVHDDFDRWLEHELDHSLAAVTREAAPPRATSPAAWWRPAMVVRTLTAAVGAKALVGGTAVVLAAGAVGVVVTHQPAPPAASPTPGVTAPAGAGPRGDSGDASGRPAASPAAVNQDDQHGQGDQNGRGQGAGDGGDDGRGNANGNGPHPTPANTPNGVSGNGNGNNGEGDRGNSGAAH